MIEYLPISASLLLVDRVGRRPMLMLSGLIVGTAMGVIAMFFYLEKPIVNGDLTSIPSHISR